MRNLLRPERVRELTAHMRPAPDAPKRRGPPKGEGGRPIDPEKASSLREACRYYNRNHRNVSLHETARMWALTPDTLKHHFYKNDWWMEKPRDA